MSPRRLPSPCRAIGCPALVDGGGYCPTHKRDEARRYDAQRGTATQRGYNAHWRRVRAAVLADEPLCRRCREAGRVTPAAEVHHRDGNAHNLARDNLEPLCRSCHSRESATSGQRWGKG